MAITTMPTLKMPAGQELPQIGFGLWKVPAETATEVVYNAIKVGYRLFDGAYDYGNEREAGEGIRKAIKDGLVTRDEIFVVSKLWNQYHRREHALKMARSQCDTWGLGYLDLFLVHFPIAQKYIDPKVVKYPTWWSDAEQSVIAELDPVPMQETWKAMETLVDEGIARNIGVSNVSSQLLLDMRTYARIPIASIQIELHPYLQQTKLVKLAQKLGIAVTAYSSFGPQSFLEMPDEFSHAAKHTPTLMEHPVIVSIAEAHGKTPAQVLLRWATQRGTAVIPKSSSSMERLTQNLHSYDFDMSKAEIDRIRDLEMGMRFNDPSGLDPLLAIFS